MTRGFLMLPQHSAAKSLALRLMAEFGLVAWKFEWNRRKRQFGRCLYPHNGKPGRIQLSWYFVKVASVEDVDDTIRHEIAHALTGPNEGHGPVWAAKCRITGAKPHACSDKPMPKGKWQAKCPTCKKEYDRHRKPKRMEGWYCTVCGPEKGSIRWAATA